MKNSKFFSQLIFLALAFGFLIWVIQKDSNETLPEETNEYRSEISGYSENDTSFVYDVLSLVRHDLENSVYLSFPFCVSKITFKENSKVEIWSRFRGKTFLRQPSKSFISICYEGEYFIPGNRRIINAHLKDQKFKNFLFIEADTTKNEMSVKVNQEIWKLEFY